MTNLKPPAQQFKTDSWRSMIMAPKLTRPRDDIPDDTSSSIHKQGCIIWDCNFCGKRKHTSPKNRHNVSEEHGALGGLLLEDPHTVVLNGHVCSTCMNYCSKSVIETIKSLIVSYPDKNNQKATVLVGNDQLFQLLKKKIGLFKTQGVKAFEQNLWNLWKSDCTLGWKFLPCLPNENIYIRTT